MVVLEFLKAIIDNFGSAIVVPFIIFIIALIFRVKPAKAFLSALYAGVSLEGFSLIIGAYTPIITPLVQNMSKVMSNVTGVELNTFDVGWQATSVVAFATSAGMIYLGLGIALQTILFLVKWTNIFQPSDLWNNYSYIVWGAMVIFKTHNFALGIACMVLLNLYSLLISELVAKRWSKYYNYPNCTIIAMHNVEPAIFAIAIDPILNLLGLNKVKLNPKSIEKKLGFIGEPMTLGFILGGIIGILGNVGKLTSMAGWGSVFTAAIATAAIMAIFPKIASMFAQAFAPITEAARVFQALAMGETVEDMDYLLVAPKCLQNKVLAMIDEEIEYAKAGEQAYIGLKMNSLTDKRIMNKLVEASCAGVHIDMVVRGICCLIPGVKGQTENIHIISIVGRFLEHSRIYIFGTQERAKIYISSADFMTRNTLRRVEVAAPIEDPDIRMQIQEMFVTMLSDNRKARTMNNKGNYKIEPSDNAPLNSQEVFLEQAYDNAAPVVMEK